MSKTNILILKPILLNKKADFSGYSLEVKNTDGSLLSNTEPILYRREKGATYQKIDTLVKKADVEKRVSLITNLLKGNIRYKMLDFDVFKIL